jgi:3-isopropylmalate/(R)-2-methylmalate dehydratase small subunit
MNVDTDTIIPKQHLKTIKRTGLGKVLFDELRFQENGEEIADFILNQAPYREAKILIAGENFGCGSSREHAPWALLDFGIRCIIAPSFADIFFNNCFKNGILPITLSASEVDTLMADANHPDTATMTVDLPEQTIQRSNGETLSFTVDEFRKHCLLNGLDDINLTLQHEDKITAFERQQQQRLPWLWANR